MYVDMAHEPFGGCDAIVVLSTMLTAMLMKRFRPGQRMACVVNAVHRNNGLGKQGRRDTRGMMVKGL